MNRTLLKPSALLLGLIAAVAPARAALVIANGRTAHIRCEQGTCSSTAKNAVLNVDDLAAMLAAGDVAVIAGAPADDIQLNAPLTWQGDSQLSLQSKRSIFIAAVLTVPSNSDLSLRTNAGAANGVLLFTQEGNVQFSNLDSVLTINADKYALVNSIAGLQSAIAKHKTGKIAFAASYDAGPDGTFTKSPVRSFSGVFEGLGNTISHLAVNDPGGGEYHVTGLFGTTNAGAIIRDIRLSDVNITGGHRLALGGLVAENHGTILQCSVSGALSGKGLAAGGITGDNYATIEGCEFDGVLSGPGWLAGIAGWNHYINASGTILKSSASGSVTGMGGGVVGLNEGIVSQSVARSDIYIADGSGVSAGGFAGENKGLISLSSASGSVTAGQNAVGGFGGFAGHNINTIVKSYATGAVTAGITGASAGFVGDNDGGFIADSYAMGPVNGGSYKAGFAGAQGFNYTSSIGSSYSTGRVGLKGEDWSVGGFIGFYGYRGTGSKIKSSYWDMTASRYKRGCGDPQDNCKGITGLKTKQLKSGLPAGFNPKIWGQDPKINGGYPYLIETPPPNQ